MENTRNIHVAISVYGAMAIFTIQPSRRKSASARLAIYVASLQGYDMPVKY